MACVNHANRLDECPQEHICECGAPLSDHHTVAAYCPKGDRHTSGPGNYRPSALTLYRFPDQYRQSVA